MRFMKADQNDIHDLVQLRLAYLLEDYTEIHEDTLSRIAESLPAYFSGHLNRDLFVFVAKDRDNAIAACCFLCVWEKPANPSFINGRTGTVLNVYTKPSFRKQGIAGELLKMLIREAEERDLDYVELKATEAGYSLYKSLGFEDAQSKYHAMKYTIDHRNTVV